VKSHTEAVSEADECLSIALKTNNPDIIKIAQSSNMIVKLGAQDVTGAEAAKYVIAAFGDTPQVHGGLSGAYLKQRQFANAITEESIAIELYEKNNL
jgi:hypothetical protein